ncbi:MAG TPA: hypothetical protein PLB38_04135, partial [bacterium]|nr:hypothetical protein [bacterium]
MGKKDKDPENDAETKRRDIAAGLEDSQRSGKTAEHSLVPDLPIKEEENQPPRQATSGLTIHESPIAQQLLRHYDIRVAKFGK